MPAATIPSWPNAKATAGLFTNLSKDETTKILESAVLRKFKAGQIIARAHEPATHLFLLKTGAVNYFRDTRGGREVVLRRLAPGEAFGLGTLLDRPTAYVGTAQAVCECELYIWEHQWVRRLGGGHSVLAENALRITLEYIRLYSERHLALVSSRAETKLARALMLLGRRIGQHHTRGVEVRITNQHLASLADIGSYTASRLLSKWQRKGAVEKSRGRVLILRPAKLLD